MAIDLIKDEVSTNSGDYTLKKTDGSSEKVTLERAATITTAGTVLNAATINPIITQVNTNTSDVASVKLEVDRNAADLDVIRNANYQTEAQVDAKDAVVLQSAKDYTYSQAEIDSKVASGGTFDPTAYDTSAVVDGKISTAVGAIVVPTKTSDITNDSGFITASDIPSVTVPTKVSDLENDSKYQTDTDVAAAIAEAALSGGEVDLSAYPITTDVFTDSTKTEIKTSLFVASDSESTKVTAQDIMNLVESNEEDLTQLEDDLGIERDVVSGEISKNPVKELMTNAEEEFDNSDALEGLLGVEFKEEAGNIVASVITSGDNIGVIGELQAQSDEQSTELQALKTQQNTNTSDITDIKTNFMETSDYLEEGQFKKVYIPNIFLLTADTLYEVNDIVLVNGIQYKCILEHTYNATDGFVSSNWEQMTFTKQEILAMNERNIQYVDTLPTLTEASDTIYGLVDAVSGATTFYNYNGTKWIVVGNTNINLEDYVLKTTLETDYIKKVDVETNYVLKSALGDIVSFEIVEE